MSAVARDWVYLLHPRPAFAVCSASGEEYDCMAASWVTPVSREPPVLMVAIAPDRATYRLIKASGKASVNVLGWDMVRQLHYLGSTSLSRDPEKMRRLGAKVSFNEGYPRIEGALAVLYCRLRSYLNLGDHDAVFLDVVGVEVRRGFTPRPDVRSARYVLHVGRSEYTTNVAEAVVL